MNAPLVNKSTHFYKGLNGLRAFSVFLVIAMHLNSIELLEEYHLSGLWSLLSGNAGVNLFFVISGFLIAEIIIRQKQNNKLSITNFIWRRVLRIFPLYYLFLFLLFLLCLTHAIVVSKITLLASVLYLSNFLPVTYVSSLLGHTWSLAVEEHFYLLWPFIVAKLNLKNVKLFILSGIFICIAAYFFILKFEYLTTTFRLYQFTIPAVLPILTGCYLAYLKNCETHNFARIFSGWMICLPFISLLVLILIPSFDGIFSPLFNSITYFYLIAYVVKRQNSRLVSFLETPVISYIGKISYGIYIWQGLFIGSGGHTEINLFGFNISQFPLNIILTITFSILSFHLFEKKFLGLKDKYFGAVSKRQVNDQELLYSTDK